MIKVIDSAFSFDFRQQFYTFCSKSYFQIGWRDTEMIEERGLVYLHSAWSPEDLERSGFLPEMLKIPEVNEELKGLTYEKAILNLAHPTDTYYAHTHPHAKRATLFYVNMYWKPEWAGETLFYNARGDEIEYASVFTPGRLIVFDGATPHAIRPHTPRAPQFRFTFTTFWK